MFKIDCMRILKIIITGLLLPVATYSIAQNKITPQSALDSIPKWMADYKIPVVGIGIISEGKISKEKFYGQLDNGRPASANTLFNVASLTKPITVLTTLRLVDAGKWSLDEPLDKYWIDPDVRDDARYQKLTTRIILSHQSGFPNWRSQNANNKLAFMFDPGTKYSYSGEGFEYLRHALEAKFHCTLQHLADSVLFKPLGMKNTRYGWNDALDSNRFANPHDKDGKRTVMQKVTQIISADWLVTTIDDYTKFALAVVNQKALSVSLFKQMATQQADMHAAPFEHMGLGWEVMSPLSNGEYILMHTGSDDGVKTLVMLLPQSKRGLVIFTNGNSGFDLIKKVIKETFHIKELTP